MPKPTFDINEYELRGLTPDVFTKEQRDKLNKTLSRVHGQIDWTAQLLGFNGPNYWGQSDPKADFSYNWTGLPETMNEKRQMQVGAFAVYNKDQEYDQWPSPFNRSEIKASGDFNIHVYEKDGHTFLGPAGQGEEIDFRYDPTLLVGASYVFDAEITFTIQGGVSAESIMDIGTFYREDKIWTRVFVKSTSEKISITKAGSSSNPAYLVVSQWEDITDWNQDEVKSQFIGLWGNKGNTLSMDFAFDALNIHGYDEVYALHFDEQGWSISLDQLLKKVGLEPTEWTQYAIDYFNFVVGENCVAGSPDFPVEIINGDFEDTSVIYPGEHKFFSCSDDCNYDLSIYQSPAEGSGGIGSFLFKLEALAPCAFLEFPCIEWTFDSRLDNGVYEKAVGPTLGPWAIANDGEYDEASICPSGVFKGTERCSGDQFCGFDNGTYDDPSENEPVRVQLNEALESIPWKMEPSIRNSLAPLRIWKNHVLTVIDQEPPAGTDYYNFLVADENRGPELEDSFRYFVRLPLEYQRNGKEWSRAVAVCNNQGYFSAPPKLSETEDDPKIFRPYLYDETYWRTDLKEYSVFYQEDFLVSELRQDNKAIQPGFTESAINFDGEFQSGFAPTLVSEYDPYNLRLPDEDGEWIGQYLVYGNDTTLLRTGFLETDVSVGSFIANPFEKDPVWDESSIKNPNVEFPDSNDKAALKNYIVSYAYFACDFSAADDPVFEPGLAHNWRRKEVKCLEKIGEECVASTYPTNTAYRLHQ